jgi:hypothetical protein
MLASLFDKECRRRVHLMPAVTDRPKAPNSSGIKGTGKMTKVLEHSANAIKSLFNRSLDRLVQTWQKRFPQKPRVIELEYRRRSDAGTRRTAVIHIDARSRRQRP